MLTQLYPPASFRFRTLPSHRFFLRLLPSPTPGFLIVSFTLPPEPDVLSSKLILFLNAKIMSYYGHQLTVVHILLFVGDLGGNIFFTFGKTDRQINIPNESINI